MEGSTSFSYKGSISDAISEAHRQRKLFVVYISGNDENSIHLERSTWVDLSVAESVSKYCIFLHLKHGSIEASQFSAIYPQNSIPSITAVGLNGVIIWKHEGYVNAENFVENMEKAWAALHLQETAATLLKVALASRNPEPLRSASPDGTPVKQGGSSSSEGPSSSTYNLSRDLEASTSTSSKQVADNGVDEQIIDQKDSKPGEEICLSSDHVSNNTNVIEEESILANKTGQEAVRSITGIADGDAICGEGDASTALEEKSKEAQHPVTGDADGYTVCREGDGSTVDQRNACLEDKNTAISSEIADRPTSQEISQVPADNMEEGSPTRKSDVPPIKSNDVYLNIRLPTGASLQTKLVMTDTLRSVKSYIDESQSSGIISYDLAVPYPRKVFSEEDMNRTLCELGFGSRQALIVVPHRQATGPHRGQSSSDQMNTVDEADLGDSSAGYFGFVKRILSYMNPFSYFGGSPSSPSSQPASNDGLQQYRPNPAFHNHSSDAEASHLYQNPSSDNASNTRRRTSTPFGSNIHTLRHDEDEGPSADRNTFWNGNSTQYGGNDK